MAPLPHLRLLGAAALSAALSAAPTSSGALPVTLTTADGAFGADTFAAEESGGENFGDAEALEIQFSDFFLFPAVRFAALRFDLGTLSDADRAALRSAALQVHDPQSGDSNRSLDDVQLRVWVVRDETEDAWNEDAATWDEGMPAHDDDGRAFNGPDILIPSAIPVETTRVRYPDGDGWSQMMEADGAFADAIRRDTDDRLTILLSTDSFDVFPGAVSSREAGEPLAARLVLSADPPAEPDHPDFGIATAGGLGGAVLKVTNLNSLGAGSLRAAVEASGARLIVFEVGGVIDLGGAMLRIRNPHVTVAGETAPDPGITLIRGGVIVETHDVVIRHVAVRPGDAGFAKGSGWEVDAIATQPRNGADAHHIVVDHCSVSWGTDEALSAGSSRDGLNGISRSVTFSNCIVAEGLDDSTHSEGTHSMGMLVMDGARSVAVTGNLFASNGSRNPQFKGGTSGVVAGNVIWNPRSYAVRFRETGHDLTLERPLALFASNTLVPGADTENPDLILSETNGEGGRIFAAGNLQLDSDWRFRAARFEEGSEFLERSPLEPAGFEPPPPHDTMERVTRTAGARPGRRNSVDARIVASLADRSGRIIDSQNEVGGYPNPAPTSRALSVPAANRDAWLRAMEADLMPPGLPEWNVRHFTYAERFDASVSGPHADPDGDERTNFHEFVFGGNPRTPHADVAFPIAEVSLSGESITLRYLRRSDAVHDAEFSLEASSDLAEWETVKQDNVAESVESAGAGMELVTLQVAADSVPAPGAFAALRIRAADR